MYLDEAANHESAFVYCKHYHGTIPHQKNFLPTVETKFLSTLYGNPYQSHAYCFIPFSIEMQNCFSIHLLLNIAWKECIAKCKCSKALNKGKGEQPFGYALYFIQKSFYHG